MAPVNVSPPDVLRRMRYAGAPHLCLRVFIISREVEREKKCERENLSVLQNIILYMVFFLVDGTADENEQIQSHPFYTMSVQKRRDLCTDAVVLVRNGGVQLTPHKPAHVVVRGIDLKVEHFKIWVDGASSGKQVGLLCHYQPYVVMTGENEYSAVVHAVRN